MRSDTLVTGIVPGGSKNQSLVQKNNDIFYAHMYIIIYMYTCTHV